MVMRVKTNLPDRNYIQLIGRDEELKTLKDLLRSQSKFYIIAIEGMGGVGKSALALEAATYFKVEAEDGRLPISEKYDYIIWTSAKIEDMTATGRVQRPTVQATLRAIISTIIQVMGIKEGLTVSEDRQLDLIFEALSQNRVLLVVDSFEHLDNPAGVLKFLHDIPPPTRVLITSRPQQFIEAARSVLLQGLTEKEGLVLIKQICEAPHRIRLKINDDQQLEIYRSTSGIPLAIVWALGRILDNEEPYSSVISRLTRGVVDLSAFCVSDSFEVIKGRKAEEIVFSLLPLTSAVTRQMLGEIVDIGKDVKFRDEELDLLLTLQLITRSRDDKFNIAPLARTYLLSLEDQNKRTITIEKWALYYHSFLEELIGKHGRMDTYLRQINRIWAEMDNIEAVLEAIADIKPSLYCDLLETVRYILYMNGDWITRDHFMQKGIEAANKTDDSCRNILFASDLGWVATYRRKYEQALRFFQRAESSIDKCREAYYRAKFYLDQARFSELAYERADLAEVEKSYLRALEEAEKATTAPAIRSTCLYYLGLLYYDVGNKGEAKKQFEMGLEVAELNKAAREADRHRSMLALLLIDRGQYEEARKLLIKIIGNAEAHKDLVRVGDYKFALARVEYKVGHRDGAWALLTEAEKSYNEVGRMQDVTAIMQFRQETGLTG